MSALAYSMNFASHQAIPLPSSAASPTSRKLAELWLAATSHARDNASDWRSLTGALIELVAIESQTADWDGYGAKPISTIAKFEAQRLVDMLPFSYPAPDPIPDPEGDIALSWDFGPGHMLTVSVGANGILSYAGLLGDGVKRHGMEPFKSDVPKSVHEAIEELCSRSGIVT